MAAEETPVIEPNALDAALEQGLNEYKFYTSPFWPYCPPPCRQKNQRTWRTNRQVEWWIFPQTCCKRKPRSTCSLLSSANLRICFRTACFHLTDDLVYCFCPGISFLVPVQIKVQCGDTELLTRSANRPIRAVRGSCRFPIKLRCQQSVPAVDDIPQWLFAHPR